MSFFLPDPAAPPRKSRKLWWILLVVLLVVVAAGIKPGMKQVQKLREQRLRAQAEALFQQKKYEEAVAKASEALVLNPQDLRATRTMALALTAQDKEEALQLWQRLLSQPGSSEADRRAMVGLALKLKRPDLAEREMEALLESAGTNSTVETERLAASFYSLKGDLGRSMNHARKVLAQSPEDQSSRFISGKVMLHSRNMAEAVQGKELLLQIARQTNAFGWEAIQLLADSPYLAGPEASEFIQLVDQYPPTAQGKLFLKADLQMKITPYKFEEIIRQTADQVLKAEKPELLPLGRWLNRYQAHSLVVNFISESAAIKSRDLLLIYLDALAAQNQWGKVEAILAKPDLPLEPVMVKIFQARTARELRQERVPEIFWEQAYSSARNNGEALLFMAQYAEKMGEWDHAQKGYRGYISIGKNVRVAYEALIRLHEVQGSTRVLRDLLKEMVEKYPEDPLPRGDLAYLNLLLNEQVESSRSVAFSLTQQYPNLLAYKVTLALGYLRAGDYQAAASVLRDLSVNWSQALPGWQAVNVAVIGANGDQAMAARLARQLPLARLKAEERSLIQPYMF